MSAPSSPKPFNVPFAEPKLLLVPSNSSNSLSTMRSSSRRKEKKEVVDTDAEFESDVGFPNILLPASPSPASPKQRMRRQAFLDAENKIRVILQETDSASEAGSETGSESSLAVSEVSEVSTPDATCMKRRRFPAKDCPHPRAYVRQTQVAEAVVEAVVEAPIPAPNQGDWYPTILHVLLICTITITFVVFGELISWYSKNCICM